VNDVLNTRPGLERNEMIEKWCKSVWTAYAEKNSDKIVELVTGNL